MKSGTTRIDLRKTMKILLSIFISTIVNLAVAKEPFGSFIGDVVTKWNADGRTMTLVERVRFVDPVQVTWDAPAGSTIDGASIPQMAWTFFGSPFVGQYRGASVIHDVACQRKDRDWVLTHRAFYHAMKSAGVGDRKAWAMYTIVYHLGPRWEPDTSNPNYKEEWTKQGVQLGKAERLPIDDLNQLLKTFGAPDWAEFDKKDWELQGEKYWDTVDGLEKFPRLDGMGEWAHLKEGAVQPLSVDKRFEWDPSSRNFVPKSLDKSIYNNWPNEKKSVYSPRAVNALDFIENYARYKGQELKNVIDTNGSEKLFWLPNLIHNR